MSFNGYKVALAAAAVVAVAVLGFVAGGGNVGAPAPDPTPTPPPASLLTHERPQAGRYAIDSGFPMEVSFTFPEMAGSARSMLQIASDW